MKTLARAQCKVDVLRRLRTVRRESARRWGRMSAHQMVCHLSDAFRMALGQKAVSGAAGPLQRTLVKWIALYTPLRWRSGIVTRPEIDQHCGGTKPGDFAADVAELERLVELIARRAKGSEWPPHPVFGRMSHGAWRRWAYLHMDHHLRQFGA
jgi:hypothetical protein